MRNMNRIMDLFYPIIIKKNVSPIIVTTRFEFFRKL